MKHIQKHIGLYIIFSLLFIPSITRADEVPTASGGSTGGAEVSSDSFVPTATGGSTGGAETDTSSFVPVATGGNTGGADTEVVSTPPSQSSSGGTTSYGSSGSYVPVVISTPANVTPSSCPLIVSYIKVGAQNNPAEVIKLQSFLKTVEGIDVAQTGSFDSQTEAAVKAFQHKYLTDTMGPWHATIPSGMVYVTTKKKINEIACNNHFALSSDEVSIIDRYVKHATDVTPVEVGSTVPATSTLTDELIGQNSDNSNTASVVNASILGRFWNFLKKIF